MTTAIEQTFEMDGLVRQAVYDHFIVSGETVSRGRLADELALPEAEVEAAYRRLSEAHLLVLQPESGEVLMANPFAAVPTAFRVRSGARRWWANCVWDGLGVLAMVADDGSVETACPDCGEALTLTVAGGELAEPRGVVHFSVPASRWWEDIVFT